MYWFCQISKWICHRYTRVPHPEPSSLLPPHTIPLGRPSAPAPSIQYPASNLDLLVLEQPTPAFLPRKSYGQRSLQGYSPWGHRELNMSDWAILMDSDTCLSFYNLTYSCPSYYIVRTWSTEIHFYDRTFWT